MGEFMYLLGQIVGSVITGYLMFKGLQAFQAYGDKTRTDEKALARVRVRNEKRNKKNTEN
jgi:hypothetical protein